MRPLFAFGSILLAGLLAQPRFNGSAQTEPLVSACVASYSRDSIVAAFGSQLTAATLVATDADPNTLGIQWPTMLGDVSVRVAGKLAPLFFVSPNQINYLVPPGLQIEQLDNGFATVEVANGNNVVASGRAQRVLAGLDQTNVQIPLEVRGKTAVLTGERGRWRSARPTWNMGTVKITPGSLPIDALFTPGTSARAPTTLVG